jgi:CubicO group peptidase (beta-lactamase class C family)
MPVGLRLGLAIVAAFAAGSAGARPTAGLGQVLARWDEDPHPDLSGVIVLRKGHVVAERYYHGETADSLHDIRSAGKSITSLLVGIARDERRIGSVADPVATYWPEAGGSAIGSVSLANVLTMRSGLAAFDADPASPGQEDRLDAAADPQSFILGLPQERAPGSAYRYNSVTASIAGIVVARATGETMADFARQHLFGPLGIQRWSWASDAGGYTKGQGNLSVTLRDFAAIGEMVRRCGHYNGIRIVSCRWLRQSLSPKASIADVDPYADGYGYFWYSKTQQIEGRAVPVSFASGNGGNKLYIIPSMDMIVAITSKAYGHGYGQKRSEDILKAILAARFADEQFTKL